MIRTALFFAFGLLALDAQAVVPKHDVILNGKVVAPEWQAMLFLKTSDAQEGSEPRLKDYERVKKELKGLYPWRLVMEIAVSDEKTFWDEYRRGMSYLGDYAITNVVMYGQATPSIHAAEIDPDGSRHPKHFRLSIGERAIYRPFGNYEETIAGKPQPESIPGYSEALRPFFSEIRASLAQGSSVVVLEGSRFRVTGRSSNPGALEDFHQFYARLFGVRDGAISLVTNRFTSSRFLTYNGALNLASMAWAAAAVVLIQQHYGWNYSSESLAASLSAYYLLGGFHDFAESRFFQRVIPGVFSISQIQEGKSLGTSEESSRKLAGKLREIAAPLCNIALKGLTS